MLQYGWHFGVKQSKNIAAMIFRFINIVIGLWLMISPALLNFGKVAADNGYITGPIVISFSTIAISECTRGVRLWNYPVGLWLLISPWILNYTEANAFWHHLGAGLVIIVVCSIKGGLTKNFENGWSSLWQSGSMESSKNRG